MKLQISATAVVIFLLVTAASLTYNVKQAIDGAKNQEKIHSVMSLANKLWPGRKITKLEELEAMIRPVSARELSCMSENIYREAANQSMAGKLAVGQVVINRMYAPKYPSTACGVIYQSTKKNAQRICQFSWACAKKLKPIDRNSLAWKQSVQVAESLLKMPRGAGLDITDGATHYHSSGVSPSWNQKMSPMASIDQHKFYKN